MSQLKPSVLAVEDDPEFAKALEVVLTRFGLSVKTVSTPEEFLEKIAIAPYDLYLVDLQLGDKSGFELIEHLRVRMKVKAPILIISGGRKPELIAHAMELGANDYIMKPLDRALLAAKLSKYVVADELKEHLPTPIDIPSGDAPVRVEFSGEVLEVDELGVRLFSKALVSKGTVLKLRFDALKEAGIESGEVLVAVASTELDPSGEGYRTYVEFDGVDVEFMQSIRRWLTQP